MVWHGRKRGRSGALQPKGRKGIWQMKRSRKLFRKQKLKHNFTWIGLKFKKKKERKKWYDKLEAVSAHFILQILSQLTEVKNRPCWPKESSKAPETTRDIFKSKYCHQETCGTEVEVEKELIQETYEGNLCYLLGQSPVSGGDAGKADKMTTGIN